jgi:hypothetical protein
VKIKSSILGLGAGLLLSIAAAHADTPDQLYQTWQTNSRMQPDIAEKAARDYLHAAPDGPHAAGLQVWLDAYHKTLATLLSRAPQSLWKPAPKPRAKQAAATAPAKPPAPMVAQAPAPAPSPPVAHPASAAPPPPQTRLASTPPEKPAKEQHSNPQPAPAQPPPRTRLASAAPPQPPREQHAKSQPAVPPDTLEGHSLVETLAFIADKIDGEGRINFLAQFRDAAAGRDIVQRLTYTASKVTMDPNRCRVSFHWHVDQDGKGTTDEDRVVELRLAKSVAVETLDQALTDLNTGSRPLTAHTQPTLFAVHIARWDKPGGDNLYFHDKDMAARVGAAASRGLELCEDNVRKPPRRR